MLCVKPEGIELPYKLKIFKLPFYILLLLTLVLVAQSVSFDVLLVPNINILNGLKNFDWNIFSHKLVQGPTNYVQNDYEVGYKYNGQIDMGQVVPNEAKVVHNILNLLRKTSYFNYFKVNLDVSCTLGSRTDVCSSAGAIGTATLLDMSESQQFEIKLCHVDRCSIDQVPENFRSYKPEHIVLRTSNPIELSIGQLPHCDMLGTYTDWSEAEHDTPKPVFINLSLNPPSYTGFQGAKEWNAIYEENCIKSGESCQHNEHLHRLLSGIQTSIAAFAAENYTCTNIEDAYIKRNSLPKYTYNLLHYVEKIGKYPERIYNLMYTFEFLLLSTCRLKPLLLKYASLMTCPEGEEASKLITQLLDCDFDTCKGLDVNNYYAINKCNNPLGDILAILGKISKIVDCVDCEKCRLHGKIKMTALQVALTSFCKTNHVLERNEIVALITTLDYLAESIVIVERFEERIMQRRIIYPAILLFSVVLAVTISKLIRHKNKSR